LLFAINTPAHTEIYTLSLHDALPISEELRGIKTIALVDNADYIRISQNIGVDTLLNTRLIAANNIFRFIRKGEIEAITSLHGVEDRKSTRLNSSHVKISYAVFCLKKK